MDEQRTLRLATTTAILFAIAFGISLSSAMIWNRAFQVDEVEHIHAAYNMRDGRVLYRDFWQGHNPLLYVLIAPVIDTTDPVGSFHRSRVVTGILLLSTVGLVGYCALRLGGKSAALAGVAMILFHTTMMERGMEVRPDGGLALCTIAALALELRDRRPLARYSAQALILGVGFLFTQKAVFATAAFGCLWLLGAIRERRPRLVLQPVALWFAPLALALLVMLPFGCARAFVQQNIIDAFFAGTGAGNRGRFSPLPGLVHESTRNIVFLLLAIGGIVRLAMRKSFVAFLSIVLIASLWANPFPWPYVHVAVLPVLAVTAAVAIAALDRGSGVAVVAALLLVMVNSVPRLLQKAAPSAGAQFATLQEIQRVTTPDDRWFDLAGLYFRPDAYPAAYAMSGELLQWYAHGGFTRMVPELRRRACAGIQFNYRTAALGRDEQAFIAGHYAHYWGNLYLPGAELAHEPRGATRTLEVLKARAFRYDGGGAITVDGTPFRRGTLAAGSHTIGIIESAAPARLIVDTPTPAPPPTPPVELYVNFD
jgi:hypothetical protein